MSSHDSLAEGRLKDQGRDEAHERELADLFRARRPAPADFRARIEERIREREAAPGRPWEGKARSVVRNDRWERVAALIPLHTGGAKLLSFVFAWPMLLVLTFVGGHFLNKRSTAPYDGGDAQDAATAAVETQRPRARHCPPNGWIIFLGSMVQLAMLGLLSHGSAWAMDAILATLLVVMTGFVAVVHALSSRGSLTRKELSTQICNVFLGLLVGGMVWSQAVPNSVCPESETLGAALLVLIMGGVLCLHLSGRWKAASLVLLWGLFLGTFLNPLGVTRSSARDLRYQLATMDLDVSSLTRWDKAATIHRALVATGATTPPMREVAELVQEAMRSGQKVHPRVWMSAHTMGWIEAADWQSLAAHPREARKLGRLRLGIDKALERGTPMEPEGRAEFGLSPTDYQQYVVPMLLANQDVGGALDAASLDALARIIVALWPTTGDLDALGKAASCVALLELLGRDDLIEELHASAQQLLVDYWIPGEQGESQTRPAGRPWGFTSQPTEFKLSMDDATWDAVALMNTFGVPEGVDLSLLHRHLKGASRWMGIPFRRNDYLNSQPRAALHVLENNLGLERRSFLRWILDQRIVIAAAMIVLLAIAALRAVPPEMKAVRGGARP